MRNCHTVCISLPQASSLIGIKVCHQLWWNCVGNAAVVVVVAVVVVGSSGYLAFPHCEKMNYSELPSYQPQQPEETTAITVAATTSTATSTEPPNSQPTNHYSN